MAKETVLEFNDVWKSYPQAAGGTLHALREISVAIPAGRRVALIGRSGSGKSTFMHLAAGIDGPSRGQVKLLGEDLGVVTETERTRKRRDHVGLVFQFFHLLPHLDVLSNVALPAMIAGDDLRASRQRARELLARVELEDRSGDAVEKLSGGEMQRVAICRALLRRPRLLLADEPTGNLDDDNAGRVMDLLLGLAATEGHVLVYATHSRELAALADETLTLSSGRLDRAAS